jgi:Putative polyhydroxyalkanoic acid system protein (PHA_gran_rgn)
MPSMSVTVPHFSTQEDVVKRLKGLMELAKQRNQDKIQNLVEQWNENTLTYSFKSFGFDVGGTVAVEPDVVRVEGKLPFAAMMFKGKIEQALRDELTRALA